MSISYGLERSIKKMKNHIFVEWIFTSLELLSGQSRNIRTAVSLDSNALSFCEVSGFSELAVCCTFPVGSSVNARLCFLCSRATSEGGVRGKILRRYGQHRDRTAQDSTTVLESCTKQLGAEDRNILIGRKDTARRFYQQSVQDVIRQQDTQGQQFQSRG